MLLATGLQAILLAVAVAGARAACLTHTGDLGECVNIKRCRPVMKLLRSRPPLRVYEELRQAHCGSEGSDPKICCEVEREASRVPGRPARATPPPVLPEPTSPRPVLGHPSLGLLDHELCGRAAPELKIYGGSATGLFEFPWMALLAYEPGQTGNRPDFRCAGTVLSRKYVLTAAHCVANLPDDLKLATVRIGEHDLTRERDCQFYKNGARYICADKYQDMEVESVRIHPEYSLATLQNDIALIRVKGEMRFESASVRPICLPLDEASRATGGSAIVTGWGATEDGNPTSERLLKASLPLLGHQACARAYRDQPFVKLWHRQLCAGGQGLKDSCNGDSGGPLQGPALYQGRPRVIQHGIVSYGRRNCAAKGSPGVYTAVAHYVDWILDNMHA